MVPGLLFTPKIRRMSSLSPVITIMGSHSTTKRICRGSAKALKVVLGSIRNTAFGRNSPTTRMSRVLSTVWATSTNAAP